MGESIVRDVDRLAASNLLTELKLDAGDTKLETAAKHFARHRLNSNSAAAERAHSSIVERLEAASTEHFGHTSDEWQDGFIFAEQQILTMTPEELLDLARDKERSKGQLLRDMIRKARDT